MANRLSKRASRWLRNTIQNAVDPMLQRIVRQRRELVLHTREFENETPVRSPLNRGYACYFSQNDEDGILLEIIRRIGIAHPSMCLEIGIGNGLVNNTLVVLAHRWLGIWIDVRPLAFDASNSRLAFVNDWVTLENVVDLVSTAAMRLGKSLTDIRVVSLDVDGNDYHIAQKMLDGGIRPDVFVVEYNAKFPPTVDFVMTYNPDHRWDPDTDYFGASLKSWNGLLKQYSYRLVACNLSGVNAFFVQERHAEKFADIPTDIEELFVLGSYRPFHRSGWRTSPKTVEQMIRD